MTPGDVAELEAAIESVHDVLRTVPPESRFELKHDLRQELAVKLLDGSLRSSGGLRVAARNWLLNAIRDHATARRLEGEYAAGVSKRYQADADWLPSWYAPHEDAEEHAPFSCDGARMMHVKAAHTFRDVETAMVGFVDSTRRRT